MGRIGRCRSCDLCAERSGSVNASLLEKMQESGVFSSGTYLVGEEIPAGEYAVISESGEADHLFYAGVYADQEKEQEISGEWHEYSAIVQLEEGTYFSFSWANCYDMTKNTIPNDPQSPFVTSGIRLGAPSITSRGFTEEDARTIARLITKIIDEREAAFETVRAEVKRLCDKHPLYQDDIL